MSAKGKQDSNIQLLGSLEMPDLLFSFHQPEMATGQTEIWSQHCVWIYTHSNRVFLVHLWSTNFFQKGTFHFLPKWGLKNFTAPIIFRQALAISYLTETLVGSSWAINNLKRRRLASCHQRLSKMKDWDINKKTLAWLFTNVRGTERNKKEGSGPILSAPTNCVMVVFIFAFLFETKSHGTQASLKLAM